MGRVGLVVAAVALTVLSGSASADPTTNQPTGSRHESFYTASVSDAYTVPPYPNGYCSFPVSETVSGWVKGKDSFDASGNFVMEIEHDHLTYTDTASGVTTSDNFYTTRFSPADQVTFNPDGTITSIQTRVGHLSDTIGGQDIGRFVFRLTFSATGQELSFTILRNAGQIGGFWSGPQYGLDLNAWCAQFTS